MHKAAHILLAVADAFSVTPEAIWGHSRVRAVSVPRMFTAFLIRKHTTMCLEDITCYLNREDHTTCIYWLKRAKEMRDSPVYRSAIDKIEEDLANGDEPAEAKTLSSRHPVLRAGARHTRHWHRLQWILQLMPEPNVIEGCEGPGASGSPTQTNQQT